MTFIEAFDKVKAAMAGADASTVEGHLAIQVNLSDEDAHGICYVEVAEGQLYVEPYDYYDRDAIITVTSKDLVRVMSGRLGLEKAIEKGVITVEGNLDAVLELKKLAKKVTKKTATVTEEAPVKKTRSCKKK